MQKVRFQLMHTIDAKLCSHLMFQNSFRNIERQNNYRNFLDDRIELWPSIYVTNQIYRLLLQPVKIIILISKLIKDG